MQHSLDEAVESLLTEVSDFAVARSQDESFMSHGDRSPYLVFGDFGLFLLDKLKNEPISVTNQDWLDCSIILIDKMLTSPDSEVSNLIQVGVLDVLSDYPDVITFLRNRLSPLGQEKLDEYIRISHRAD